MFENSISPKEEMIAFETLWAIDDMSEKKFANLFKENELPSEVISKKFANLSLKPEIEKYLERFKDEFSVAVLDDFQYPKKLQDAEYPIELFYYKGNIDLINKRCISVVGSRQCSNEGIKRTKKLVKMLVKQGFVIVSGLARGIDTAAMETVIEEGGQMIGVIGTPINEYYPKENKALQDTVAKQHLLISHVPFYRYKIEPFAARKYYFPRRNKTMSAISEGTVIVEASDTSGTLTQARAALQQKRKLFILNTCFENKRIKWPATYARKGAIRVRELEDILINLDN